MGSSQVRYHGGHRVGVWGDIAPPLSNFSHGDVKISSRFRMLEPLSPKKCISKGGLITGPPHQMLCFLIFESKLCVTFVSRQPVNASSEKPHTGPLWLIRAALFQNSAGSETFPDLPRAASESAPNKRAFGGEG